MLKKCKVFIYGPNPESPFRTGGVAVWLRYLRLICQRANIAANFLYIDHPFIDHLPLPDVAKRALGSLRCAVRLLLVLKSTPRVVHVNASMYPTTLLRDFPIVAAATIRGFPIFFQVHGGRLANLEKSIVSQWLSDWMLRKSTCLGIHPGPQWNEFTDVGFRRKMIPMYNLVPSTLKTASVDRSDAHFLFLGRLVEEKGARDVLEAFIRLRSENLDEVKLTVAGEGPLLEELRLIAHSSGFADFIHIPGFVQEESLDKVLSRANVFVLPSRHQEGFPFSFLECAERGMACIVTENSAIPEVFTSGEDFLPIDVADPNSLYVQMKRLTVDIKLRTRLGRSVDSAVKACCTIEAAAEKFRRLYDSLAHDAQDVRGVASQEF